MENSSKKLREIERGEAWLAGVARASGSASAPRVEAVSRAKLAVRAALTSQSLASQRWQWRPVYGAWAAAAMLLLSAGMISVAVRDYSPDEPAVLAKAGPTVSPWVQVDAALKAMAVQDDAALTALDVEVVQLEQGPLYAMDGGLEELTQAVEEVESEVSRPWAL